MILRDRPPAATRRGRFLHPENHAIVAWFKKAIAYKENANKKSEKNDFVSKAPSERDLAPKATEGECEMSMGQLQ